jgi:hypothetical protein
VEGKLEFPEDPVETAFDPDVAEAALEHDDALLDLFADRLGEIHPRLTRTLGEGWQGGGEGVPD